MNRWREGRRTGDSKTKRGDTTHSHSKRGRKKNKTNDESFDQSHDELNEAFLSLSLLLLPYPGANLVVCGEGLISPRVPARRGDDTVQDVEWFFHAPETSSRERSRLVSATRRRQRQFGGFVFLASSQGSRHRTAERKVFYVFTQPRS